MTVVTRDQWGARPPKGPLPTNVTPEAGGVAVHYEGPSLGAYAQDREPPLVREIQAYHMDHNGWLDVAYSYLVGRSGLIYEGRGPGHRTAANGTNDSNQRYYAVCYVAGAGDELTDAAKAGLNEAIDLLQRAGAGADVRPHSAFLATSCPGDVVRAWLDAGRPEAVVAPPPAPPPQPAPPPPPHPSAPVFPLPAGHWFGPPSKDPRNHSGFYSTNDRSELAVFQRRMTERGWTIDVGGQFTSRTSTVVEQFQAQKGLSVDGLVGPLTWSTAFRTDNVT